MRFLGGRTTMFFVLPLSYQGLVVLPKSTKMTEKQLEQKLIKAAKARGGEAYKFVPLGRNGVPDRIILLPYGKIGFIEVKSPEGGRLTELQAYRLKCLRGLGFKAYVLNDPEKIEELLDEIQAT